MNDFERYHSEPLSHQGGLSGGMPVVTGNASQNLKNQAAWEAGRQQRLAAEERNRPAYSGGSPAGPTEDYGFGAAVGAMILGAIIYFLATHLHFSSNERAVGIGIGALAGIAGAIVFVIAIVKFVAALVEMVLANIGLIIAVAVAMAGIWAYLRLH